MTTAEAVKPRLKARYSDEIVPALKQEFCYDNPMQVPGLVKIVGNLAWATRPRTAS